MSGIILNTRHIHVMGKSQFRDMGVLKEQAYEYLHGINEPQERTDRKRNSRVGEKAQIK